MTDSWMYSGLFAIGVLTGLRTLTPIAVFCWMTLLGRVPANVGWGGFAGNKIVVGLFTALAFGELIGDKLPKTPSRTSAPGLTARIIFGGLIAAILASSVGFPEAIGTLLGAVGAVVGTFGGRLVRTRTVAALKCPDLPIALIEDAITIGGSILVCSAFAH
ncbi:DUF4126 domain-containing protein [Acidicapsa ligni]|uniref:DUF4126 domain-containing protein n=1 Tax=Acidicapsa ligni TaxID=542300 RepID=UPI0021DFFEC8|nr:DUF4126 domain-containing protein [Acidicapsa ligni]